jgi:hypothetical protein
MRLLPLLHISRFTAFTSTTVGFGHFPENSHTQSNREAARQSRPSVGTMATLGPEKYEGDVDVSASINQQDQGSGRKNIPRRLYSQVARQAALPPAKARVYQLLEDVVSLRFGVYTPLTTEKYQQADVFTSHDIPSTPAHIDGRTWLFFMTQSWTEIYHRLTEGDNGGHQHFGYFCSHGHNLVLRDPLELLIEEAVFEVAVELHERNVRDGMPEDRPWYLNFGTFLAVLRDHIESLQGQHPFLKAYDASDATALSMHMEQDRFLLTWPTPYSQPPIPPAKRVRLLLRLTEFQNSWASEKKLPPVFEEWQVEYRLAAKPLPEINKEEKILIWATNVDRASRCVRFDVDGGEAETA